MPYKAVFFDAGETLLHPYPSFPELFIAVCHQEGIEVDAERLREQLPVLGERFLRAAEAGELWSTTDRSRGWWASLYRDFMAALGYPFSDRLAERLYATFTDRANYRLFPDVRPCLDLLHAEGLALAVISNF